MKKFFSITVACLMGATMLNAADIWTGNKHVSWEEGGLQLEAAKFADAKAGDKLVVTYTGATDGIEFKLVNEHFDHLAGSREAAWINGDGNFEQFLTAPAVEGLKAYGLELIGANFTVTKVDMASRKKSAGVWSSV